MLLEIVVENGTSAIAQEADPDETAEDDVDDAEDDDDDCDDDDDDDDDCDDSESDNDYDLEIGMEQTQALAISNDKGRQSKSLVRPWIDEDDEVRIISFRLLLQHLKS